MGWADRANNVIKAPINDQINVEAAIALASEYREGGRGIQMRQFSNLNKIYFKIEYEGEV